jgi:hypothetical protein
MNLDRTILATLMQARILQARITQAESQEIAAEEWVENMQWFASNSAAEGSFYWFCRQLDLEPDAVREAINAE